MREHRGHLPHGAPEARAPRAPASNSERNASEKRWRKPWKCLKSGSKTGENHRNAWKKDEKRGRFEVQPVCLKILQSAQVGDKLRGNTILLLAARRGARNWKFLHGFGAKSMRNRWKSMEISLFQAVRPSA